MRKPIVALLAVLTVTSHAQAGGRNGEIDPRSAAAREQACNRLFADAGYPVAPWDRRAASKDEARLTYAVDRRVDGCPVMVPVGAPGAMLPLPKPKRGPMLQPAPAQ